MAAAGLKEVYDTMKFCDTNLRLFVRVVMRYDSREVLYYDVIKTRTDIFPFSVEVQ